MTVFQHPWSKLFSLVRFRMEPHWFSQRTFFRVKTCIVVWENGYGNGSCGNPSRDTSACRAKWHFSGEDECAPERFCGFGDFGLVVQANQEKRGETLPWDQGFGVEEAKAIRTLILDTNVLISSWVRSEGITRVSLTILLHDENYCQGDWDNPDYPE